MNVEMSSTSYLLTRRARNSLGTATQCTRVKDSPGLGVAALQREVLRCEQQQHTGHHAAAPRERGQRLTAATACPLFPYGCG
jgi:hypothetical protein